MTFPIYLLSILLPAAQISSNYLLFCCLLYGLVQTSTVLIHEMGHAYAALCLKCSVAQILLWPLGGICYIGRSQGSNLSPKQDIIIAISGPAVHIPLAFLYYIFYINNLKDDGANEGEKYLSIFNTYDTGCNFYAKKWDSCLTSLLMRYSFYMQIMLFAFNVFTPAFPLDGGRILCSALLLCGCSKSFAAKIMGIISCVIGIALMVYGSSESSDPVFMYTGSFLQILIGIYCLSKGYQLFMSSLTSSEYECAEFQNMPIVHLQTNQSEV